MQRLMSVLLVVGVAACGDAGGMQSFPDAGEPQDASASGDAPTFPGLTLDWADMPALPGAISPTVTVTSVKFHIDKLEVLGDGGAVPEATRNELDLLWSGSSSAFPITFFSAPPAIYSKVRLSIDKDSSNAPSVEIMGSAVIAGTPELFRITSTRQLDLEIVGYNITLGLGESKTITVMVGLDAGLENIDWAALPKPSNERILDDTSANMAAMDTFFDDLEDVFTAP